jgi:hypothetical protein
MSALIEVSSVMEASIHARSTPRDLPSFPHAVDLTPATRLGLALHEVIVVGLAAGADEEGGAHERGGAGTELLNFGDVIGERCCVDEDVLVESGVNVSTGGPSGGQELEGLTLAAWRPWLLQLTAPCCGLWSGVGSSRARAVTSAGKI